MQPVIWNTWVMRPRSSTVLIALAAVIVASALTAAIVQERRVTPAPNTSDPTGVVQAYLTAVITGDDEAVLEYLDPALGCRVSPESLDAPDSAVATVVSTRTQGNSAQVVVEIDEGMEAISVLATGYSHREGFDLGRIGDTWVITEIPWPLYDCAVTS